MRHYAGLDVCVKETSVCIVDESGKVCRETKCRAIPRISRGPFTIAPGVWSESVSRPGHCRNGCSAGLAATGLPVVRIETRHTKAFLQAQVNKSDRNDARGIAQMMRVNLFRPVHVKTLTSQKRRALLTARKLLQEKALAVDNDIRGLLRNFGLKVGPIGASRFETRTRELVDGMAELAEIIDPLLEARRKLRELFAVLHRKLLVIVRDDTVCRRLMTVPGVGPVVSMAFTATIDVPARFKSSKAVGAALGLTPILNQSGDSKRLA